MIVASQAAQVTPGLFCRAWPSQLPDLSRPSSSDSCSDPGKCSVVFHACDRRACILAWMSFAGLSPSPAPSLPRPMFYAMLLPLDETEQAGMLGPGPGAPKFPPLSPQVYNLIKSMYTDEDILVRLALRVFGSLACPSLNVPSLRLLALLKESPANDGGSRIATRPCGLNTSWAFKTMLPVVVPTSARDDLGPGSAKRGASALPRARTARTGLEQAAPQNNQTRPAWPHLAVFALCKLHRSGHEMSVVEAARRSPSEPRRLPRSSESLQPRSATATYRNHLGEA